MWHQISKHSLLFHCSAVFPQPVPSSATVPWMYPTPHSASPALIIAQLSCCNSLLSDLPDFNSPLLPMILAPALRLFITLIFHSSLDNSLLIISKPKLLCLTCKGSIISPHPIESIFFPRKTNTQPLNQSGCHLNFRRHNPHACTTTIFPLQMTFALLRSPTH